MRSRFGRGVGFRGWVGERRGRVSPVPECPPHRSHGRKCGHILTERVELNPLDSEAVLASLFCLPLFSALIITTSGISVRIDFRD